MKIDPAVCTGCRRCIPYCPVGAIIKTDGYCEIDREICVECGVCYRSGACTVDAIKMEKLEYPRILRSLFSDPLTVHKLTGIPGRGTAEMKTNDVTNRYTPEYVGIAMEIGRPGISTSLGEVEKVTRKLIMSGLPIEFEPDNPITILIDEKGEFKDKDIRKERVLSAIVEMRIPYDFIKSVLETIREISEELDTVFSLDFITRNLEDKRLSEDLVALINEAGFELKINGKTCVGYGRR